MIRKFTLIALTVFSIRLVALTLFYFFIKNKTDSIWYWMLWGIIDFPSSLLIMRTNIVEKVTSFFHEGSSDFAFFFLHASIGSINWIILVFLLFLLWHYLRA